MDRSTRKRAEKSLGVLLGVVASAPGSTHRRHPSLQQAPTQIASAGRQEFHRRLRTAEALRAGVGAERRHPREPIRLALPLPCCALVACPALKYWTAIPQSEFPQSEFRLDGHHGSSSSPGAGVRSSQNDFRGAQRSGFLEVRGRSLISWRIQANWMKGRQGAAKRAPLALAVG